MLQCTDIRLWYIGSYTIMAKPIKSLELHYPIIRFLSSSIDRCHMVAVTCQKMFQSLLESLFSYIDKLKIFR